MAYDKTTFLSGLAMGLCSKGNPTFTWSGKMLYNGVELPNINEVWTDKRTYPYAMICDISGFGRCFRATSRNGVIKSNVTIDWSGPCKKLVTVFDATTDAWGVVSTDSIPADRVWANNLSEITFIWTNYDILNTDGSVYFAGSAPVPLEDAFTKGYRVGAELRSKRVIPETT